MANVGDLTVVLKSDASQLTRGVEQSGQAITDFAEMGHRNVRALSSGFAALAIQISGIPGPLAKITEGLLLFSGGHEALLGAAAAVGGLAIAYQALTADAREAEKATKDLEDALDKFGEHGKVVSLEIQASGIRQHIEDIQEMRHRLGLDNMGAAQGITEGFARLFGYGDTDIIKLQSDLDGVNRQLQTLNRQLTGQEIVTARDRAERYHEILVRLADQINAMFAPLDALLNRLEDGLSAMQLLPSLPDIMGGPHFLGELEQDPARQLANKLGTTRAAIGNAGAEISDALTDPLQEKLLRSLGLIGQAGARVLVQGLIEGTLSLGKFLERSMIDIFTTILTGVFGRFLGGFLGTSVGTLISGGGGGGALSGQLVAGPNLTIGVSGMAPAMNPLAAARDQEWHRFLRESILQAHADGFHG